MQGFFHMGLNKYKLKIIHALPLAFHKDFHNAAANLSCYNITPKPRYVHFEITYRCSCKCVFCSRWTVGPQRSSEELSTDEIINFFKKAVNLGIVGVSFSGGEPFLRKDIFDIAAFCKDSGLLVHVNSNGTLIDEKNCGKINTFFDSILISVDSHIPATHDHFRGVPGTFQKAIKALQLLDRSKTMVQMVVNAENIDYLFEYVSFMSTLTDKIRLQPLHQNPDNLLILQDEEVGRLINVKVKWDSFVKKLKESGLKIYGSEKFYDLIPQFLSNPNGLRGKIDCFMGSHAFYLDPYGNVVPCEGIRKPFGNIRHMDLCKIWEGANAFRKLYNTRKNRPCVCLYTCLEGDIMFRERFLSFKKEKLCFPP
jgi:MoaA/NifB/PqqE/SkfB family radical SAM enzyme